MLSGSQLNEKSHTSEKKKKAIREDKKTTTQLPINRPFYYRVRKILSARWTGVQLYPLESLAAVVEFYEDLAEICEPSTS